MNWSKTTAIGTAILALVGVGGVLYSIRESDITRMEKHIEQEGHPRLVEQVKHTRELLEQRMENLEKMVKGMSDNLNEVSKTVSDIRACMHRIEARQDKK